jgi:UPF0755 protein
LRKSIKFTLLAVILLLVLISFPSWLAFDMYRFGRTAASLDDTPVPFEIAPGERFKQVVERLYISGIIKDEWRFKLLAYIKKADTRFKAGEYRLVATMTPLDVIDTLVQGRVVIRSLTIPEGYSLFQIAAEFERAGLKDGANFLDLATRPETAKRLGIEAPTLEGYLFPDTYFYSRNDSVENMITRMVQRFREQLPPGWAERAAELDLSLHQLVTLASIIEKETGDPSERPLVSSVFHNRLKLKMRMDSDPTVVYGLTEFDGRITRRHLTTPTPYNTYVIKGLPPGPIANPGRASIEAALYPAQTDFLYFVARKDRGHQFSTNLPDHNRAVREHQRRPQKKTMP